MTSLYRKWRPQALSEVIGQSHIVDTISRALAEEKPSHAYLFTGPRGTGKTTVARILAKSLNCLEISKNNQVCNSCMICNAINKGSFLDIIEIDAASNRGIDEMRELRDKVRFKPTLGKKKVYIIDEVHMLTKEAFNALLKTLEEPPEHAVFILATTEPHKVPQTIISRTQRFDFRPATILDLKKYLQKVSVKESIKIEDEAIEFLAQVAEGSFRDSLGLLEQIQNINPEGKIDRKTLERFLGLPSYELVRQLLIAWSNGDDREIFKLLKKAEEQGINIEQLTKEMIKTNKLAMEFLVNHGSQPEKKLSELEKFIEKYIKNLELTKLLKFSSAMVDALPNIKNSPVNELPLLLSMLETLPVNKDIQKETQQIDNAIQQDLEEKTSQTQQKVEVFEVADDAVFRKEFLNATKLLNHSIFATLKVANILRDGKNCIIEVYYPFHLEQLNKRNTKLILNDLIKKFACDNLEIKLNRENKKIKKNNQDELATMAEEIFNK